ncbi:MAG: hypothetical protein CME65_07405 [Halobacteriovoraceae bacterium]|nr:hypothetical protein [Halobacteriovoraceae bacterium]
MSIFFTSCFDSGGGEDGGGGGLFNNHQLVENIFVLVPPTNNTFLEDNNIDFVLAHSHILTVSGTPTVDINIGGSTVSATYLTGSGTSNLTFRYTVVAGDNDNNGIEIDSSINLNGGSIQFSSNGQLTNAETNFASLSTPNLKVDTTAPSITLITPPNPDTYYLNQQLSFIAVFDDMVQITGSPRLSLDIGGVTRYAEYASGAGTSTVIFRYTVQGTDVDLDGINLTSPLELNGGSIADINGNPAALTFIPFPMVTTFVDGDTPYVTGLIQPNNNTYFAAEFLDLTLNFTEAIDVTGAPQVGVTIGSQLRYFSYVSGSGSANLLFRYLTQEGDDDDNGISVADTIDLNGGTLRDSTSVDADLNLAPPLMPNVLVNAGRPTVDNIIPPLNNTYTLGEEMFFTLNFDKVVDVTGTPRLQINLSSGPVYANYISGTGSDSLVFRHLVAANELDLDGIEIATTLDLNSGTIIGDNSVAAELDMTTAVSALTLTGVLVDAAPASIVSVTPPSDAMYVTAQDLDFTIGFSKIVNVTGTPRIALDMGGSTVYADYVSGSASQNLLFRYTIQGADSDVDGIGIANNSIELNGGTILDGSSSPAGLDMSAFIPVLTGVTVNVNDVEITSITPPSDDTYIETENLDFVANISEAVDVTGTPRLQITIGATTKYADYISGTGTSALTFRYVVEAGIDDSDGITLVSPLDLNGGTIQNALLQNLDLTFTPPAMPNVFVDTTPPSVAITSPIDSSYINIANDSATFAVTGTCNESGQTIVIQFDGVNAGSPVDLVCDGTNFTGTVDTTGLAQGTRVMTAVLEDVGGNSVTSTGINLTKDTIAPTIALVNPADASGITAGNDSATFAVDGTCDEAGEVVAIEIDGVAATSQVGFTCNGTVFTGTIDTTGLADGTYAFTAIISDTAGNETTTAANNVTKDLVDPTVSIASPVDSSYINIANDSATFAISGNCSEASQTVTIEVDGGAAASPVGFTCNGTTYAGTIDTTGLAEGAHTIQASIQDLALNTGTSSIINLTKDTVAPNVALTTPADLSTITAGNDSATFAVDGTCDENTLIVDIQVDGVSAASQVGMTCDGSNFSGTIDTTGLADGTLAFTAVITDAAGNETTSTTNTITKDATVPTVTIDAPLDNSYINIANDSATFAISGTCNESGVTVDIEVDGGAATSPVGFLCDGSNYSGTIDTTGLTEAAHTLQASITDASLNTGTSSVINITRDVTAPVLTLVNPADLSNINAGNDSATFAVDGACDTAGQTVNIQIDGVDATSQVGFSCNGTNYSGTIDTTVLSDATFAFTAILSDAAGNETATTANSVTKDSSPPTVAITSPVDSGYINIANDSATFAVSGTCNEAGQTVSILVDAVAAGSQSGFVCNGTNFSGTISTTAIAQGALVLTAELSDGGGNTTTSTGINLTKDTVAPTISLTNPADSSSITSANDSATFIVDGTCDEASQTVNIQIDGSDATSQVGFSCNGATYSGTIDTTGLADATYAFTAVISDAAGNEATSTANTVTKDSIDPTVTITSPVDSSYINIANDSATFPINGNCNEASATVVIEVDSGAATSPVGFVCNGTSYAGTIDTTGLSEGAHTIQAKIQDGASNEGTSAVINLTKDTVAPTVALTNPADSSNITSANDSATFPVDGTCDDATASISIEVDSVAAASQVGFSCNGTTYSGTIDTTGLAEATLSFTAVITDAAGNSTTSTVNSITKDVTDPTVAITSPVDSSYINVSNNSATFAISGTCDQAAQTVNILVDGGAATSPVGFSCNGTNFSGTIDTTGLSAGAHTLQAELSDGVNTATSAVVNVTKDIIAPEVSSMSAPIANYYLESDDLNFVLTMNEATTVTGSPRIQLDVGGATVYATYASGSTTTSLTFTYTVQAGDQDTNGIGFGSSVIDLNSGTMLDIAGNTINLNLDANSALPNVSSVFVDGVLPTVTITDAADITAANETTYSVSGTCSENGRTVTVSIGGIAATPTCSSNVWTTGSVDVSGLADNPSLSITADHQAASGNNAVQAQVNVDKDSANAQVAITFAQNITAANDTDYVVSGTCTDNGQIVDVYIGALNFQPNCSGGNWTTGYVDVSSLTDNPAITITADHVTATQASTTVSKDTTGPVVTISSAPNINVGNELSYVASGTCSENGEIVDVYIDSLNFTPTCSSGTWTTGSQDVSSIPDGTGISVTADHETSGGTPATQASTTINKDSGSPTVADLSVPTTLSDSADLDWNLKDPGGYTIDDYIINYRVKGSSTWLVFSDGVSLATAAVVDGLLPSTTYEFRVRVQYDTSSFSEWTSTAEGTTKPDDPLFDSPYKAMNVGGSTDTSVVAYYDNTRVYLNGVEIASSPLSAGQVVRLSQAPDSLTTSRFDVIDADKPIFTAGRFGSGGNTSKGNVAWQPTAWAGTSFSFNSIRSNPQQLFIYATENATVTVKQGGTTLATTTISAGGNDNISWSVYGSYQITSTGTILAYHVSGNLGGGGVQDPKPLLPSHTQLIGFPSNSMRLTTDLDGTNYSAIHSNSTTTSGSLNKSDVISISPQGSPTSLYQSDSLLITSDKKTSGASFADSNGNKAAPFLPTNLMKNKYVINNSADYVAFASKEAGTIDIYSPGQTIGVSTPVATLTLSRTGGNANAPYRAYTSTQTGSGYRYVSTVPMAAWYQPDNDNGSAAADETILYGTDE